MKKREAVDTIMDLARKNHGVVTVSACEKQGVSGDFLRKFAEDDPETAHEWEGIYIIYPEDDEGINYEYFDYVRAVGVGGEESFLYADTVLELHNLARARPRYAQVATPNSKTEVVEIVKKHHYKPQHDDEVVEYDGIPSQNLKYAFLSTFETPYEYLYYGANQALERQLVNAENYSYIVAGLDKRRSHGRVRVV
jgi:predicted transcriptional regulator of viral defense system